MSVDPTRIDIESDQTSTDPRVRHMRGRAVHGNTPFDMPFMTEVSHNLWHGGIERGLNLPHFIRHIVSLYPWEQYPIKNHNRVLSRVIVEMHDAIDQGFEQIDVLAAWVNVCRETGPVLVHCQAGLNRSSLVVAKALILSGEARDGVDAVGLLRAERSPAVLCNPAFEAWVLAHEGQAAA